MVGSGCPFALQGRKTSLSASTDTLAEATVVMRGFIPLLPASNIHGKGGAAVGRRELIRPVTKVGKFKQQERYPYFYLIIFIKYIHFPLENT